MEKSLFIQNNRAEQTKMAAVNWKRNLIFLWSSQFLGMAGFALVMPFMPLFIGEKLGTSNDQIIGFWVSMFHFFGMANYCIFTPILGRIADTYGRKRMIVRMSFAGTLIFPLMYFAPNVVWLVVIRAVATALLGTTSAAQSLVASSAPHEKQGFVLGTLSTATWGGVMFGFFIGGFIMDLYGFCTGFMACGVLLAIAGILVAVGVREDIQVKRAPRLVSNGFICLIVSQFQLPRLGTAARTALLFVPVIEFIRGFDSLYLVLMVRSSFGETRAALYTGIISATACLGGLLAGVLVGWISDRTKKKYIIIPALLLSAVSTAAQPLSPTVALFAVSRFFQGFSASGLVSALQIHLSKHTATGIRATVFGFSGSFGMAGVALSSLASGLVISFSNVSIVFYIAAGFYLIVIPWVIRARNLY